MQTLAGARFIKQNSSAAPWGGAAEDGGGQLCSSRRVDAVAGELS